MSAAIVNNRIAGTRITVFDVYHYLEDGDWTPEEIASVLSLSAEQLQAAVRYIEEHKAEVLEAHRQIEERNARGNPPEIEALREASRRKMEAWLRERQKVRDEEKNGEGSPGGR
jgi:uncharacterized protein (DUF433 family)